MDNFLGHFSLSKDGKQIGSNLSSEILPPLKCEKSILIPGSISAIRRHRALSLSRLQFLLRESLKLRCNPLPFPMLPPLLLKFLPYPVFMFPFPFEQAPLAPETLLTDLIDPA